MSMMKTTVTPDISPWDTTKWDSLIETITTVKPISGTTLTGSPVSGSAVYTTVSPPKGKTLTAKTRINKATLTRLGSTAAFNKVKRLLVKELLEQLMTTGVVKVTSETSLKGAVTFTATVVANETA